MGTAIHLTVCFLSHVSQFETFYIWKKRVPVDSAQRCVAGDITNCQSIDHPSYPLAGSICPTFPVNPYELILCPTIHPCTDVKGKHRQTDMFSHPQPILFKPGPGPSLLDPGLSGPLPTLAIPWDTASSSSISTLQLPCTCVWPPGLPQEVGENRSYLGLTLWGWQAAILLLVGSVSCPCPLPSPFFLHLLIQPAGDGPV